MGHSDLLNRITVHRRVRRQADHSRHTAVGGVDPELLAQGVTAEAILDDYPKLEADDIRACIAYAQCSGRGRYAGRRLGGEAVRFPVEASETARRLRAKPLRCGRRSPP